MRRPPPHVALVFGERWRTYLDRELRGTLDPQTGVYRVSPRFGVARVPGPGSPCATIVVEELAAQGVRRFVLVGLAGALDPDLAPGSYVVCTRALRDEGTSLHYRPPGRFALPDARLTRDLRQLLERERVPYRAGPTWTTDAPYRETREELRRFRREGILTVEMEASAVFTVARCRGFAAAALFVVSDRLDEKGWEPWFRDARRPLYRALDLAAQLG